MTSRNVPLYLFRPFDTKQPVYIVGCSQTNTSSNVLALIEPLDTTQRIPRGNLLRILGKCGDWKAEREAVHWTYQPHKQPKVSRLEQPDFAGRLDLRGYRTLHVDPPGCRDVDDCVTFWEGKCVITIADVGAWVAKNPVLLEFAKNGQTLYDNGRAVRPMFPYEWSEDAFSLLPGQDRLGVSLILEHGKPPVFQQSIVRVTESYTYDDAVGLSELQQWASFAAGRRLDDDPHTWIEALMISYNLAAASRLIARGKGLLRCHNPPNFEMLQRYQTICPEATRLAESSATYQDVQHRAPHWGLGMMSYTHMTSPIRRWADVYNQLILFGSDVDVDMNMLNECNKRAKKHARDLFFLDQLQHPKPVQGVVLDVRNEKCKVWVDAWKRILTVHTTEYEPGTRVLVEYHLDMNQPTWKKRMVIRVSKDCPV